MSAVISEAFDDEDVEEEDVEEEEEDVEEEDWSVWLIAWCIIVNPRTQSSFPFFCKSECLEFDFFRINLINFCLL